MTAKQRRKRETYQEFKARYDRVLMKQREYSAAGRYTREDLEGALTYGTISYRRYLDLVARLPKADETR